MYGNSMFNAANVQPAYPQVQPLPNPQMYPQYVRNVLPGRMVKNDEDISIADIPMDRSLALFPKEDGSCIYAKAWTGDGTIQTVKFIPEEVPSETVAEDSKDDKGSDSKYDDLSEKIDSILDLLTSPSFSKKSQKNEKNDKENDK